MATLYRKANADLVEFVYDIMARYHGQLAGDEVSIGCLMAFKGEDDEGPALKVGGYPAIAAVKVTPYKQRVQGIEDAVIVFDEAEFSRLKPTEREAVVDHELQHLELVLDEHEIVKRDDCGRPKLRLRLHDVQIGGFESIIRRHGKHAIEAQQIRDAAELLRQMNFPWCDDMAGPREGETTVEITSDAFAKIARARKEGDE